MFDGKMKKGRPEVTAFESLTAAGPEAGGDARHERRRSAAGNQAS